MKFSIVSQNGESAIGVKLKSYLERAAAGEFNEIVLIAAFVKRAGTSRIEAEIKSARAAGCTITSIVGIDHDGTSRQGLEHLYTLSNDLYVVHSTNPSVTFHPKAYKFSGDDHTILISGSSNLTAGGLFTNVELCTEVELENSTDADTIFGIEEWVSELKDTSKSNIVKAGPDNIDSLLGMVLPETFSPPKISSATGSAASTAVSSLFGAGNFAPPPPPPVSSASAGTPAAQAVASSTTASSVASPTLINAPGGWKKLSNFDVHPTQSPGSMVIPKALWDLFPAFQSSITTGAGVVQSEVSFSARYVDGSSQKIGERRLIEYRPAATHARPNIERRLAFHDRAINPDGLNAGDVLVFSPHQADANGAVMTITRLRPGSARYSSFPGINRVSAHGRLP